jgi:hypothetical protein
MTFDLHPTRLGGPQSRPPQRHPRTLFSVPVTLRHLDAGGISTSPGITLDISQGGLGAMVRVNLRVGEMVEIDVHAAELALKAVAIVRYSTDVRSGFEFVGLTSTERQQIATSTVRP